MSSLLPPIKALSFAQWCAGQPSLPKCCVGAAQKAWETACAQDERLLRQALNALDGMCRVARDASRGAARADTQLVVRPSDITETIVQLLRDRLDPSPF